MNILHIEFYDSTTHQFIYVPQYFTVLKEDFESVHEIAVTLHELILGHDFPIDCMAYIDHDRFIYVTKETYDVHLHRHFINP